MSTMSPSTATPDHCTSYLSPPQSPSHSDVSYSSIRTAVFSDVPEKPTHNRPVSPHPAPLPAYASTSTISRDSRASNDEHILPPSTSRTHLVEPNAYTRLPKARVFVHRDTHRARQREREPDRPRNSTSHDTRRDNPVRPHRPYTPVNVQRAGRVPSNIEKRCVSDLHEACRMRQPGVVTRSSEKFDTVPWGDRNRVRTDLNEDAIKYLKEDDEIPDWIPDEEKQLWMSSTIQDPCVVESEHGSRWATSLRSISNFYRPKERDPPCIRGSILDVHPPTLGERLGFNFDRRRAQPNTAAGRPARFARKTTRKDGHPVRQESPNAVSFVNEGEGDVSGMDEYVGFLVENDGAREIPKHRKGWRRFMKRAKA